MAKEVISKSSANKSVSPVNLHNYIVPLDEEPLINVGNHRFSGERADPLATQSRGLDPYDAGSNGDRVEIGTVVEVGTDLNDATPNESATDLSLETLNLTSSLSDAATTEEWATLKAGKTYTLSTLIFVKSLKNSAQIWYTKTRGISAFSPPRCESYNKGTEL